MTTALQQERKRQRRQPLRAARGSDDDWSWWREAIKDPEYRLRIWAWQALAAAFVGDEHNMNYYSELAEREKALIASRQNSDYTNRQ
jgi:hypothetical protein